MPLRSNCANPECPAILRSAPKPKRASLPRSGTPRFELDREPLAPASAPRAQHRTATYGAAADKKSVSPLASRHGWLVSALHRLARCEKGRY